MRVFKAFLWVVIAVCLANIFWIVAGRPHMTAQEAQTLREEYTRPAASSAPCEAAADEPDIDFTALQQQYPDIKAWLTIPGTVVDYPVLQSGADDPEHYLRRNYDHEWRMAGSLFFQFDCTPQSRNLVIYGHNMNDGSMFGVLKEMLDEDFLREHAALTLETPEGVRNYKIVAAMKTDINQIPFTRVDFAGDEDFLSFAGQLLQTSGYTADQEDRLLTLVTCAYDWEGARTVVVAVETE